MEVSEEIERLVLNHDKQIGEFKIVTEHLSINVEHLSSSLASVGSKLEDFASLMSQQNIMMERFSNMDANLRESFDRVHKRMEKVELTHVTEGCSSLLALGDKLKVANKRIADLESNFNGEKKTLNDTVKDIDKRGVNRLLLGLSMGFTALAFVFGYMYIDLAEQRANAWKLYGTIQRDRLQYKEHVSDLRLLELTVKHHIREEEDK